MSRAPYTAGSAAAISTSASSSGSETAKSSRSEACEARKRAPRAGRSPARSAATASRTRAFSVDDVTHAAVERLGKRRDARATSSSCEIAERPDAEQRRGALALGAARVVVAARVAVGDARVDHDERERRRQRHRLVREAPRVEEERRAGVREARGHLVHHPDARADEVVLRTMGEARQGDVVERARAKAARSARSSATSSAALDERPAAERHVGGDRGASKPRSARPLGEHPRAPLDVVEPVAGRALSLPSRYSADGAAADRRAGDADAVVLPQRQLDRRPLRNGRRQHEAVVVVRVLADQVHAARARSATTSAGRPKSVGNVGIAGPCLYPPAGDLARR